jgi:hypothetical protein
VSLPASKLALQAGPWLEKAKMRIAGILVAVLSPPKKILA